MNHNKRARNRQRETGRSHQATRRPTGHQNSVSASQTLRGLYSNPRCCHAVSVMTGCVVQVLVKTGTIYEGILVTVSADYEIVMEAVHVVEKVAPGSSAGIPIPEKIIEKMVFKFAHIVYVKAKDCDLEFATRGESFLTDTEISDVGRGVNGQVVEKELEEWTGDALEDMKTDHALETGLGGSDMANGWSAEDMFKTNEEKYGVQTLYDDKLSDYTTPLDKEDTKEFRDRRDRAERLAREIEASPDHAKNAGLESSDGTEEEKYSSVVRPGGGPPTGGPPSGGPPVGGPGYAGHGHPNNRYVPPHLRGAPAGVNNHPGANSHTGNNGHHPVNNSHPGNQPPRLRSPRQMHNTSQQMGGPRSRTPPQSHSPQPPHHHPPGVQTHQPPPHHMMQQHHMRPPHHPPHPQHPSQLHVHRGAPNQVPPPPPHHISQQQRVPQTHHIQSSHPMSNPRSPQGMHPPPPTHLRTPPHSLPPQQMSPRQPPPPPQEHRSSPVSPNQLKNSTPDVIREEKAVYNVDISTDSSKPSLNRKVASSPQQQQPPVASEVQSIPTSPSATTENSKPLDDKNIADLKDFSRNFQLTDSKTSAGSDTSKTVAASTTPASKTSPNSMTTTTTTRTTDIQTTTAATDKNRIAATTIEQKETTEGDKSEVKKSVLNPNAKAFNPNPNAKPFVPQQNKTVLIQHPSKTPTPPRPQSQPSPVLVPGPHGHMPFIMANVPQGAMVSQVNQKMQYVKKSASNIPHQRPQQPNDIPHGIPVSMAAGHPIITQVGFHQHGGQFMYPVQQGGQTPQGMGPQVIPQPMPYQPPMPYQKQQPPMYRQVTPQANIPNAANHQGAQGIQQVQDGNHPQVHVVSNQAALQHHQAAVAMQQAQQQQQQQQQQAGHYAHQQQIQQQQQAATHLQPQSHPHAQPNTTPPQQQGQHTQQGQPGGPTLQQPGQPQQPGQQQQHTSRPSPSPVHHMPPQQIAHMTPQQMQQHQQLLYQSSLQPSSSQPMPGQPIQSPQSLHPQHPAFSGGHPTQFIHYPPTSTMQASNITNVTPVHNQPHPHPQQAGVVYIQNPNQGGGQGGIQYPAVSGGSGQHMSGPYIQTAQGNNKYWPGPTPHQPVQFQQGN